MASRAMRSSHVGMGLYEVEVARVQHLTPHLRRLTFSGEGLRSFRDDGPDQRVKLLLPRPGQPAPLLPAGDETWYRSWLDMPEDTRPILRTYTVRAARPESAEMDVDMLAHGDTGPGSAFASRAEPGDRVAMYAAWGEYEATVDERQLIMGDHCALPAIAAIVDRWDDAVTAEVVIEIPAAAERIELPARAGVSYDWRLAGADRPGAQLRAAVTGRDGWDRGNGWDYAWVCADSDTVRAVRRHLVRDRGMSPDRVMFMGYWRTDGAIDDLPADSSAESNDDE